MKDPWPILPKLSAEFEREKIPNFICATSFFHWKDFNPVLKRPNLIIVESEEMRRRVMDCCNIPVISIDEFRPNVLETLSCAA